MFTKFTQYKVAEYDDCGRRDCERILTPEDQDRADEEAVNQFWTVYGVKPDGMERALIDTDDAGDAVELATFFNELVERALP